MEPFDISTFRTLLTQVGELYCKTISEQLFDIYWQTLKPFKFEEIQQAFEIHFQNSKGGQYFPTPANVTSLIEHEHEQKALLAWTKVKNAIRGVGSYQSVAFDDALIHAVLEMMGGWVNLCAMTFEEMSLRAQVFQTLYVDFMSIPPVRYPSYLCGISEIENTKKGYLVSPPLQVGDIKKVEQVIATGNGASFLFYAEQSTAKRVQQLFISQPGELDESF